MSVPVQSFRQERVAQGVAVTHFNMKDSSPKYVQHVCPACVCVASADKRHRAHVSVVISIETQNFGSITYLLSNTNSTEVYACILTVREPSFSEALQNLLANNSGAERALIAWLQRVLAVEDLTFSSCRVKRTSSQIRQRLVQRQAVAKLELGSRYLCGRVAQTFLEHTDFLEHHFT